MDSFKLTRVRRIKPSANNATKESTAYATDDTAEWSASTASNINT